MKKLPLGIQSFSKIVEGDYVYVDKTRHIYNLINGASYYFLSRPRRFGKSLLLDTIGEVFGGNRELFKGLWIYGSDYGFEKYPVIRLDMSRMSSESPDALKDSMLSNLKSYYSAEGFDVGDVHPSDVFAKLILLLYKKYNQRVVVLIDEYDKPILDHIGNPDAADANRQVVRGFYGILKSMDAYLRFTLITGVSKFTKTSIFSELNNLLDITMTKEYAQICGIPVDDLEDYFGGHIGALSAHAWFKQYDNIHEEILAWYDGYSWDGESRVINPFSLLSFFEQKKFERFWYASGTPKFLIDIIKKKPESYILLKNLKMTEHLLDSFDIHRMDLEPLLFQTGYLTVKEVVITRGSPIYVLEIPNYEVRNAFNMQIVAALTESGDMHAMRAQMEICDALASGDLQKVLDMLRGLFASIPYNLHVDLEAYYHSIFYAVMTILGFDMDVEVSVSKGRVDAVLELDEIVYVFEFKYCKCLPDDEQAKKQALFEAALDEAMAQINARGYAAKYQGSGKTIYQAAFAFLGRDAIEMRVGFLK
ncbi:MAG: ATP-binding protein [Oscillospiraceae bacterium]|nr:ATP-binding protein [Oscillospiraceae bacterium]